MRRFFNYVRCYRPRRKNALDTARDIKHEETAARKRHQHDPSLIKEKLSSPRSSW